MVEETQELPVAEEPTPTAEAEPKENVDDLLAELDKAGVETTQQLQGKFDAGAQAGNLARLLGEERKRVEIAQAEINRLKSQPKQEDWEMSESTPVDIEAATDRSVEKAFMKREQAQQQAQAASIQAYNYITQDPNFHLVKDVWDAKIKDPGYIVQVQTGQINPVFDYQKTVVDYFQKMAQRASKTIKELSGTAIPAPHIESGDTHSPDATTNIVSEGDDKQTVHHQLLDKMHAKVAKGYILTDEEEALVAEAVLLTGGGGFE